jgi:hypothetical protein
MGRLIDSFNKDNLIKCKDNKWYISKPIYYNKLFSKIKDAFYVLNGKYIAVYFGEDI